MKHLDQDLPNPFPFRQDIQTGPREPHTEVLKRPKTRAECAHGPRPCPWVSCKYHLWPEVAFVPRRGKYRLRDQMPDLFEMEQTCTLDLSEDGGMTLEEIGHALNITRERVRQIEAQALKKIAMALGKDELELLR